MKRVPIIVVLLALVACDGGIDGISIAGPTTPPPPLANAGGIWEGSITDDNSGVTSAIAGVIIEIGLNVAVPDEGRIVDDQGIAFVLSTFITWPDGSNSSNVTAFSPSGTVFADDSTVATGSLDWTVAERSTLDGSLTLNLGTGDVTSTISMTYNADYERGSDRARIVGTWADSFGVVYNIDAAGIVFAQGPGGCVYNGSVNAIYASFNAYSLRLTVSGCEGIDGDYRGLGVLGDDVGVDDAFVMQLDNAQVAISDVLLKQ
jgi:hypothetical protein